MEEEQPGNDSQPSSPRAFSVARDSTEKAVVTRALTDSRGRLDVAVRLTGIGFWYCDLPSNDLWWDEQAKKHFFIPGNVEVTTDLVFESIHPADRHFTKRAIQRSIDEHTPCDVVIRTVDPVSGAVKWVRAIGSATYGLTGVPIRFDGVALDVTTHKQAEEKLREADRRKDEFLALLAHELRNPLAPLRNGLEVLRLADHDPVAVSQTREMMDRQLAHMIRLIDDLLDISRINRKKMTLKISRLRLDAIINSAVETARPAIDLAGHTLTVDLPGEPVYLEGDLARLAQVFANLLTNSAKYTDYGGRICLTAKLGGDSVAISVEDSGIGIAPEALNKVFDMFSQVDRTIEKSSGGLGIGLALVERLAQMHGGNVRASSPGLGKGSTFTVCLPVAPMSSTASQPAALATPSSSRLAKLRILVVDDNQAAATSTAMMLRLIGNEVWTAHNGLDAIDLAQQVRPQVILMDVGMPQLNGYDATRRIRQHDWGRQIVIIALTGRGQDADCAHSREAGCDGQLVKPTNLADLKRLLATLSR